MGCCIAASADNSSDLKPDLTKTKSWVAPVDAMCLRKRLITLGNGFTLEVSPADVNSGRLVRPHPQLKPGTQVYINMVKPTVDHFQHLAKAADALVQDGLTTVPHLPVARFETADAFRKVLDSFGATRVQSLLVLGGNDLGDQVEKGACAYAGGAQALLTAEIEYLKASGIAEVVLAGHPDGHPAFGGDSERTAELLVSKARVLLTAGFKVAVATQFCFDAHKLIAWLGHMRQQMMGLIADVLGNNSKTWVTFHIGLPGPTPRKKLERIAKICEVPSFFISSAFDEIDRNHDGMVSLDELRQGVAALGLARQGSRLHQLYVRHAGANGLLSHNEFSQLLVEDALASDVSGKTKAQETQPGAASGPSVFVDNGVAEASPKNGKLIDGSPDDVVWPEELVLALATYCERLNVADGEVVLHLFPFGGLPPSLELVSRLCEGSWPPGARPSDD